MLSEFREFIARGNVIDLAVGVIIGGAFATITGSLTEDLIMPLVGWIANDVQPPGKRHSEYLATLKRLLPAPMLGEIPWLEEASRREDLGQYLDLSALDRASSIAPAAAHPAV